MRKLNMDIYAANFSKHYKTANKHEKGIILNELCGLGGFHKKHVIRLLKETTTVQHKEKPCPPYFISFRPRIVPVFLTQVLIINQRQRV